MSTERFRELSLLLRDIRLRLSVAGLLVFAAVAGITWHFLPEPLPKVVRLGTGPEDGHYRQFGRALRTAFAQRGIDLQLVATAGSTENIRLLLNGEIDVGLVQGGNLRDEDAERLQSIATVFYEPVIVVTRADWGADSIRGGRIAIGAPGSGTNTLARDLMGDQGVTDGVPPGTRFVEIGTTEAVTAIRTGEVDSAVFVTSLEVPWVHTLFADPDLRVTHFELAEAFTRYYRYLDSVVIPTGLIDLRAKIPAANVPVIATKASLVIRPEVHRALIPLFIASSREVLFQGDLMSDPEEFPSPRGVEAPIAEAALQYFDRGPTFFYRWLPFNYAFAATRLTFLAIPLLTLLYPLYRSAGPTYRWVVERRVYRWYKVLRRLEERMDACEDAVGLQRIQRELERVGDRIRTTHVPSRHGASLFALRLHHRVLLDRLAGLQESARASSGASGRSQVA